MSNDLDPTLTGNLYGSKPIGIEVQTTVYGGTYGDWRDDVIYVRQKLINKGLHDVQDAYLGVWADFDLGNPTDDYIGVDTVLQLFYSYNATAKDLIYDIPPAAGVVFLQLPLIPSPNHAVKIDCEWRRGYRFAPLAGFQIHICADTAYRDPRLRTGGAIEMYNNLRGYRWNGLPAIDPTTGKQTRFCVAGDPINKVGWTFDYFGAHDCNAIFSVGPFTMAKGDTQEVVYALIAAQGIDRLQSLQKLKLWTKYMRTALCVESTLHADEKKQPESVTLSQNYPNPFREQTTISFQLPERSRVRLRVFDALGREVETVVDREVEAGMQQVEVEAKKSGVFFYQLEANGVVLRMKMIVLR